MTDEQRIDLMEKSLERHLNWIDGANDRVSTAMTLSLVMLGALAALLPPPLSALSPWQLVLGAISAALLLASLAMSAFVVFPRMEGPKTSLIYFGKVAESDPKTFDKDIRAYSQAEYLTDLIQQAHVNACIATVKFTWIQRAMRCTFLAVVPWTIAVYSSLAGR